MDETAINSDSSVHDTSDIAKNETTTVKDGENCSIKTNSDTSAKKANRDTEVGDYSTRDF